MSLKTFTAAYIEAALWSSVDESSDQGGAPLDKNYGPGDIAPATLRRMKKDAKDFYQSRKDLWGEVYPESARGGPAHTLGDMRAGHDFWLTRNRHGSGFWDEGLGERGKKLTDAAHAYGSFGLYVGDDGKVHGS